MAGVIGYALSPVDLIPDFIPAIGYVDDLLIVPAGIYLSIKMIPKEVFEECREKARVCNISNNAKWIVASIIVLIWLTVIFFALRLFFATIK
ncbi:MAG: DUF1232 domain-containing protein [Dehalococcoidia bacterium]|nr:MAG: DUF1232 domain-containing protein [Dehalococcoidia bacterium]